MSLLDELNDAELVVTDEDLGLLYVWYGDAGFQVINEAGRVVDRFAAEGPKGLYKPTLRQARALIEAYRRNAREVDL